MHRIVPTSDPSRLVPIAREHPDCNWAVETGNGLLIFEVNSEARLTGSAPPLSERWDWRETLRLTDINEIQSAMRLSIQYDVDEFNDAKRARYISAITVSISSQTKVHDLATYVQDIEKLGERDIIGLEVLNRIMNRESDWKDAPSPAVFNPPRLHPTTFTHRAAELSAAMTEALTGKSAGSLGQAFSREDGLQICYRLQGFGLAEVIEVSPREVRFPITARGRLRGA
jgi:hypothetical protein